MDPTSSAAVAGGWLTLATGPYGGAFIMGMLLGTLAGIYLWNKFHVTPRLEQEKHHCEERINAIQAELDTVKMVAEKWNQFMERKAFEFLEKK